MNDSLIGWGALWAIVLLPFGLAAVMAVMAVFEALKGGRR